MFRVLFFFSVPVFASLTFTDPLFNRLDSSELAAAYARAPESVDGALLEFFQAESATLRQEESQARRFIAQLESRCGSARAQGFKMANPTERARLILVCVLLEAEFTYSDLSNVKDPLRLEKEFQMAAPEVELTERMYVEGRMRSTLPPARGQDFGRAFLALHSLKRLKPELSSVDYFLGRAYQIQGNLKPSARFFAEAVEKKDARARWVTDDGQNEKIADRLEPANAGVYVGLYGGPQSGVGARVGYRHPRWGDLARSVHLFGYGATRGVGGGGFDISDRQSIRPVILDGRATIDYGISQFYGLGNQSQFSQGTDLTRLQVDALLGARYFFAGRFYAGLGLAYESFHSEKTEGPYGLANFEDFRLGGLELKLGMDTTDHSTYPRQGAWLEWKTFWAREGSLSTHSLARHLAQSHFYFPEGKSGRFSGNLALALADASAPVLAYPSLGGSLRVPGVRTGRFRDRALGIAWVEYGRGLWGPLAGAVFGVAGRVAPEFGELFERPAKFGGGVALEYRVGFARSVSTRLEYASFDGESLFQALLAISNF